jgi:hypothetical protein
VATCPGTFNAGTGSLSLQVSALGLSSNSLVLGAREDGSLVVNGVTQAAGDYTASSLFGGVSYLTGSGTLHVVGVVPEPEAVVLLGAGVAAVGFLRRRRHA